MGEKHNAVRQEVRENGQRLLTESHGLNDTGWSNLPGDIAESAVVEFLFFCEAEGIGDVTPFAKALGIMDDKGEWL